jgi:hypothetical protein
MRTLAIVALVIASAAHAAPRRAAPANAKTAPAGKTPPACGVHLVPLAVGNSWTYTAVDSHLAIDPAITRLAPPEPKTIVVTVKSIDGGGKGKDSVITLEEKLTVDLTKDPKKPIIDERTVTSTITCGATRFDVSPEAFYFNGEPGGFINLTLDKLERVKGTTLQLTKTGGIGDAEWRDDLSAHWTRVATKGSDASLGSGQIELERKITPQPRDNVTTAAGQYPAEKLGITTTGRVTLDKPLAPDAKPMELPAAWITTVWIADNVGIVQTQNSYGHKYQLSAVTLK